MVSRANNRKRRKDWIRRGSYVKRNFARLLPTIRNDMNFESDAMRDAGFENLHRMRVSSSIEENTAELADFLSISEEDPHKIVEADYTFSNLSLPT